MRSRSAASPNVATASKAGPTKLFARSLKAIRVSGKRE
jgi:hypothetical protein